MAQDKEEEKIIQVQHKGKKALLIEEPEHFYLVACDYSPILSEAIEKITGKAPHRGERIATCLKKLEKGG